MTYTILPGDKAPRFEKLLATDGSLYSQEDFEDKPFKVDLSKVDTSLEALTSVGAKSPFVKHFLISFIEGKRFESTF